MKFLSTKLLYLTIGLILISFTFSTEVSVESSKIKPSKGWAQPLLHRAKDLVPFANLSYCPKDKLKSLNCPLCSKISGEHKLFDFYKYKKDGKTYTFALLFSVVKNSVKISFSGVGDAINDPALYKNIYNGDFKEVKLSSENKNKKANEIKVEKAFYDVYYGKFSEHLHKAIKEYQKTFKAKPENHEYVFVGHNFGGALALLAAYDLIENKLIKANDGINSPSVVTYGGLSIGNLSFALEVNKYIKVMRINKKGDLYSRMQYCKWAPSINSYECGEEHYDPKLNHLTGHDEINTNQVEKNNNYVRAYLNGYGPGTVNGLANAYSQQAGHVFMELGSKSNTEKKNKYKKRSSRNGWSYNTVNPSYIMPNLGNHFDMHGYKGNNPIFTTPLGAEVVFSNNFNKELCSTIDSNGNCLGNLQEKFKKNSCNKYYNKKINEC